MRSGSTPRASRRRRIVSLIATTRSAERTVGVDRRAEALQHERARQLARLGRSLGIQVLDDGDQRDAEAAGDEVRGIADEGRIGLAEDDVRPAGDEAAERREDDVRQVVGRPGRQSAPGERGRRDADDLDAVPCLPPRTGAARRACDHGHGVRPGQPLAQLGQELRRRLGARPVVLVQHEKPFHVLNPRIRPWRSAHERTSRSARRCAFPPGPGLSGSSSSRRSSTTCSAGGWSRRSS